MELRLADLLASLSLVTDLGMGYQPEQALESCLIACGLAHELNMGGREQADVYYTSLLLHVGCTAYAHEQALLAGGDDIWFRGQGTAIDFDNPREMLTGFVFQIARGSTPLTRARGIAAMLTRGNTIGFETNSATCEVAMQMARRIGMPDSVQQALYQMFERWDGKGLPRGVAGDDIALAMRVAQVGALAALFARIGGPGLAREVIGRRSGTQLDPKIADVFARKGARLLEEIATIDTWQAMLDAEPRPHLLIADAELDRIARAFADAVDLKSPCMHRHSVEVAALAEGAARELGLDEPAVSAIQRAGMFHDLGRVGVPNGIWEKPGPLSLSEWEQVRLHPYHSERILSRSQALAEIAAIAGAHHERCDGSGYHRQLAGTAITMAGRVLAAADAYQAMTQERSYRPAFSPEAAAAQLAADAGAGRLDYDAVDAVLAAAGQTVPRAQARRPAGLTEREVEVLRLAAQGLTNREMGRQLSISPKTVGHHIQHIYDKIGVSTRASATMFAMEHDLLTQ